MNITKKSQAIDHFQSAANLARALGLTRGAINFWPEDLTERQINEITGAIVRSEVAEKNKINKPQEVA